MTGAAEGIRTPDPRITSAMQDTFTYLHKPQERLPYLDFSIMLTSIEVHVSVSQAADLAVGIW